MFWGLTHNYIHISSTSSSFLLFGIMSVSKMYMNPIWERILCIVRCRHKRNSTQHSPKICNLALRSPARSAQLDVRKKLPARWNGENRRRHLTPFFLRCCVSLSRLARVLCARFHSTFEIRRSIEKFILPGCSTEQRARCHRTVVYEHANLRRS